MTELRFMQIDMFDCPDGHYGSISEDADYECPFCGYIMKSAYHRFAPKKRVFMFR
jgi:hypothetical protein